MAKLLQKGVIGSMDRKKKVILAVSAAIALFFAVSAVRYFLLPDKPSESSENAQPQENATSENNASDEAVNTENLGDMKGLNGEQKALMETLITTSWMDTNDNTLRFATTQITRNNSGSDEGKTQALELGAVQKIENESGETTHYVACVAIDKQWTLLVLHYGTNAIPLANAQTGQIVAASGSVKETTITLASIGDAVYRPFEAAKADVRGVENIGQAIEGSPEAMTSKIQDYCRIVYPTATTATWTGVEHVLHEKDQDILYFKLNDAAASTISVLYQPSSGAFEVQSGEKTEFSKEYTTHTEVPRR